MDRIVLLLLVCCTASVVRAHVALMLPQSRFINPTGVPGAAASVFPTLMEAAGGCHSFSCLWFNQGCQPGCSHCTDQANMPISPERDWVDTCSEPNGTMAPTLDPALRTYQDSPKYGDWTRKNPWRAPGFSPVFSPCGLAGGGNSPGDWMSDNLTRHIRSGAVTPPFIRRGFDAVHVPPSPKVRWQRGGIQEVGWSIFANKGGGYAWRLCPNDGRNLTEDCFQQHHLEYASGTSWVQHGSDATNRTAFPATRVNTGTRPSASSWTRTPIPPCAQADGSPVQDPWNGCPNPMFPPPVPGLFGDGPGSCVTWAIHGPVEGYQTLYDSFGEVVYRAPCTRQQALDIAIQFQFTVIDKVVIPADYAAGDYVLSFRLDAEQTPQVWTQCADVILE